MVNNSTQMLAQEPLPSIMSHLYVLRVSVTESGWVDSSRTSTALDVDFILTTKQTLCVEYYVAWSSRCNKPTGPHEHGTLTPPFVCMLCRAPRDRAGSHHYRVFGKGVQLPLALDFFFLSSGFDSLPTIGAGSGIPAGCSSSTR